MSLEGLRAWIGEVERKLGKRTRVFLALAVVAIGLGGAAIYLAIDARENSVSERDVQELQQELEAQIDEAATGAPSSTGEESVEPTKPAPETAPEPQPKPGGNGKGAATGGVETGGASPDGEGATAPDEASGAGSIQDLLEKAKARNAEAEADANEK